MRKFLPLFFLQAFLLSFVWEVTQLPLYLTTGLGERANYLAFLSIHWRVSLFDALDIVVAYLLAGLIMKNIRWAAAKNKIAWVLFVCGLVTWQAAVEYFAVYIYHRWAYAPTMPLIFGIGLSPIVQMIVLPIFAVLLSRRLVKE